MLVLRVARAVPRVTTRRTRTLALRARLVLIPARPPITSAITAPPARHPLERWLLAAPVPPDPTPEQNIPNASLVWRDRTRLPVLPSVCLVMPVPTNPRRTPLTACAARLAHTRALARRLALFVPRASTRACCVSPDATVAPSASTQATLVPPVAVCVLPDATLAALALGHVPPVLLVSTLPLDVLCAHCVLLVCMLPPVLPHAHLVLPASTRTRWVRDIAECALLVTSPLLALPLAHLVVLVSMRRAVDPVHHVYLESTLTRSP